MLVCGLGLRGLSLLDELVAEQTPLVEGFLNRGVLPNGSLRGNVPAKGSFHLCPKEFAVLDFAQAEQLEIENIGTSRLDASLALLFVCREKQCIALAHIVDKDAVRKVVKKLLEEVLRAKTRSVIQQAQNASRKRRAMVIDVSIVGGFQDPEGVTNDLLEELLLGLKETIHLQFRIDSYCAGVLNDSSHNGNEEDKRGPRGALVTAICINLKDLVEDMEDAIFPVPGFNDRGPGLAIRLLRNVFLSQREVVFKVFVNGKFVIEKMEFDVPDQQICAILLHLAASSPEKFLNMVLLRHVAQCNIEHELHDWKLHLDLALKLCSSLSNARLELQKEDIIFERQGNSWKPGNKGAKLLMHLSGETREHASPKGKKPKSEQSQSHSHPQAFVME